jgi:beta-lactamase class A
MSFSDGSSRLSSRRLGATAFALLAFAACSPAPPATPAPGSSAPTEGSAPATSGSAPELGSAPAAEAGSAEAPASGSGTAAEGSAALPDMAIPEGDAGMYLQRVLQILREGPGTLTPADIEGWLTPEFAAQVNGQMLIGVFAELAQTLSDARVAEVTASPDGASLVALLAPPDAALPWRVTIATVPGEPPRIAGLLFSPAVERNLSVPADWTAWEAMLPQTGGEVTFFAAEVVDGTCVALREQRSSEPFPLGSAFKTYVLDAVAREVAAGRLAWTDTITIQDELKSLPSGTMQTDPVGTTHTIAHAATQMIAISDNTATDHLLMRVGRETVEAAVAASGHSRPELNRPFMTTREIFLLKGSDDNLWQAWPTQSEAERRATLATVATRTLDGFQIWEAPRGVDTVEWFASGQDLCRVMVDLHTLAAGAAGPEVRTALSTNPGIRERSADWSYMAYKGGSEPGVLNLTWYLERADGRTFFFSMGVQNTVAPLPDPVTVRLSDFALRLVHATP